MITHDWVEAIERPDTRALRSMVLARIANFLQPGTDLHTYDWTQVDRAAVERVKQHFIDAGMRPTSVRFQLSTLRSLLRRYAEEGAIDHGQLISIRAVKLPNNDHRGHAGRALSRDEMAKVFSCRGDTAQMRMDCAVFATLITTGMRVSELCNLKTADLGADGLIRFQGKGGKVRNTWITGPVSMLLDLHRGDCNTDLPWLFQNTNFKFARQLSRYSANRALTSLSKQADIEHFTPHDCRRTVATILLDEGVDVFVVSDLLGHSSVATTQLYDKRPDKKKKDALQKLHEYMEQV